MNCKACRHCLLCGAELTQTRSTSSDNYATLQLHKTPPTEGPLRAQGASNMHRHASNMLSMHHPTKDARPHLYNATQLQEPSTLSDPSQLLHHRALLHQRSPSASKRCTCNCQMLHLKFWLRARDKDMLEHCSNMLNWQLAPLFNNSSPDAKSFPVLNHCRAINDQTAYRNTQQRNGTNRKTYLSKGAL